MMVLDDSFDAPPTAGVFAAAQRGDADAVERELTELVRTLRVESAPALRAIAASAGAGDEADPATTRALRGRLDDLVGRRGAPLRVGPARFYLAEPLAALGVAAAEQRDDAQAASAWLEHGGMGRGDSGRLAACRIAMALDAGEPVAADWIDAVDPADPAVADWSAWLRASGLSRAADAFSRPHAGAQP